MRTTRYNLAVARVDKYELELLISHNQNYKSINEDLTINSYKMRNVILLFILIPVFAYSANQIDTISTNNQKEIAILKQEITQLNKELNEANRKIDTQNNIIGSSFNGISTQLNAGTYLLAFAGIILTILAVVLGIYIKGVERKIVGIKEETLKAAKKSKETITAINKETLTISKETEKNKDAVVEINRLIQNDIEGLYLKIKREETKNILDRLLEFPEDIYNLAPSLTSRELEKEDYLILKKAFLKYEARKNREINEDSAVVHKIRSSYILLFFQHFLDIVIDDKTVKEEVVKNFLGLFDASIPDEIVKSTKDFITSILKSGIDKNKEVLNKYFEALSLSKYRNFSLIYEVILVNISDRDKQFEVFNILTLGNFTMTSKVNYAKSLINVYKVEDLSEFQKSTLESAKQLVSDYEK